MWPWEKRLRDLSKSLQNCGETYFSPDLFRQNVNHFLQTSRTVTFIIQKNKSAIPNYDDWYSKQVLAPWKNDAVMTWAKDARNFIEKEGDLEMYSRIDAAIIFSYLRSQDIPVELTRETLLSADLKRVEKLVRENIYPGAADAAALQIERRWVANSLPEHELVWALTYVYSSLHRVCRELALHLKGELDESVPHPTELDPASNDVAQARFIKLATGEVNRLRRSRISQDPAFKAPAALIALRDKFASMRQPKSLEEIVANAAQSAEFMFGQNGGHYPMLSLYDEDWKVVDTVSTIFADQTDKFLFWRMAAKRAAYLKAYAFIWVSEIWIRDTEDSMMSPIRDLPIKGEQLCVVGGSADRKTTSVEWNIIRPTNDLGPGGESGRELVRIEIDPSEENVKRFFFVELMIEELNAIHAQSTTNAKL